MFSDDANATVAGRLLILSKTPITSRQ